MGGSGEGGGVAEPPPSNLPVLGQLEPNSTPTTWDPVVGLRLGLQLGLGLVRGYFGTNESQHQQQHCAHQEGAPRKTVRDTAQT